MVPAYRKSYLVFFLFSLTYLYGGSEAFAQKSSRDTTYLEGLITSDRSLSAGKVYVVKHNVKVTKDATLTIPGNTKLYMGFNTSIVIEGGLKMNGGPGSMIEVSSINPSNPGIGILVRGFTGKDVNIKYTKFSQITAPLKFDSDW